MANYFWNGSVSQAFNNANNWVTTSGGSTKHTSVPGASDDLFFDAATLANQCDFATANGLTVKSITVQDGHTASTLFNTVAARSMTIKDTLTVNEHTVFAFAETFTFIFDGSGTQFTVYDGGGTNDASVPDAYIKLGLNAGESMFSSETVRGKITFDFTQASGSNSMTLVDGVYPNMTNIGTVHAKFITSDASATAFNTYGSVDMLDWSGGSVTSTSRNVHDYDKEFFFEALTTVEETFQFGHTTARFKSGASNFRLPVFGDVYTNFGNNTTNTFNVQYHKVVIEAGDNTTNYAFIQLGKTLECNELVIRDGGRLYGPAAGNQVASAKIKSVKRPTVQGDWNFRQIADGIYESINNIPTLPVTEGGTGLNTVAVNSLLIGQGQLSLSTLAMGSANEVLKVNSGGTALEFGAVSGGSTSPAGSDGQIQYNNSGSFGGDADLVFDDSNNRLILGSLATQHDFEQKFVIRGTDAGMLIEKHDDSASGGPGLFLYRYSASVADGDLIGQLVFRGEGSTGNPSSYITLRTEIEDTTEGTKDGSLIVRGLVNNTQTDMAEIHAAGLTLNQGTFNGNIGTDTYKPVVYMDSGNVNVTTTEVTIPFDTEVLDPAGNASSTTDGHIRLAAGGYYRVSYSIPINDDSTTAADRTRVFVDMQTDDNDSFSSPTTVAQSRAQVYTRENSGGSGLSTSFIYQHTANDYIRLRVDAELGTDISTETNECQISIEYLGPA